MSVIEGRELDFNLSFYSMVQRFYRFQKSYDPPSDVQARIVSLLTELNPEFGKTGEKELMKYELSDSRVKYDFLSKTFDEFQHGVPNSLLYMIRTVGDAVEFYNTRVSTNTPYDDILSMESLPPNLHVQKEPLRFHPETDTMFGGISAFPKSSTIVTGLRTKKKYRSFQAKRFWP